MKLKRPVTEVITARTSRRRYEERPIDGESRGVLEDFLSSEAATAVPFDTALRFELVAATEGDRSALRGLGTYGMIRGAPGFVVGAVSPSWKDMEDYGYAMERIILLATDLGLGTCWLGGTFTKSSFASKISTQEQEVVPAVAAIGHATEQRGAMDKVIRWGAGSKKRRPWEELFYAESFTNPLTSSSAGELATPLEMVRRAPSASNKQPWRVVASADGTTAHFFLQRDPQYNRNIKTMQLADLQRIDMGIGMCHFELTVREQGLEGAWSTDSPDIGRLPPGTEFITSWTRSDH